MSGRHVNRRRHERFSVPPMYTALTVNVVGEPKMQLDGHCYDLSEGGVQFELDDALPAGTPIELSIELPNGMLGQPEQERVVRVVGNVVWNDQTEPGPVRLAAVFSKFVAGVDKDRLFRHIAGGHLTRAA